MMGDINFLMSLTQFPKEQINDETVELLRPYFAAPDFNYNAAKKVCSPFAVGPTDSTARLQRHLPETASRSLWHRPWRP